MSDKITPPSPGSPMGPGPHLIDARNGKVPDGLYRVKRNRYMFIKNGIFHFPMNMVHPDHPSLSNYPLVRIRDLQHNQWRFFIRARYCLELYPKSAKDIKGIVAKYGANL